ncbi:S-adenosylmethionine:tRNA ribosyltransferase-isomerase, partial [Arthrospira platensis SPKY1]|nr:S-adenosylmethionine:tRNA ribosyltransferase-isomerase [Arthrospira platensis SPKY1]
WNENLPFAQVLESVGHIPLPPYLNREDEEEDKERYQTVYAKEQGSVAAPTAGLHFTENVLQSLEKQSIDMQYVNLHVGAGTFLPVKAEQVSQHEMHREQIVVSKTVIENLAKHSG